MKIEGIIGNPELTTEAISQEIKSEYPTVNFSNEALVSISEVWGLRKVIKLLEAEQDVTSKMLVEALGRRLDELARERSSYFKVLRPKNRGGMQV